MIKGIINLDTFKTRVYINGKQISLRKSQKIFNGVADFTWGYGGAGPTQLSFALLYELTNEKIARSLCDHFKHEFVARLHQFENWQISEDKIMKIIFKCVNIYTRERKKHGWDDLTPDEIDYP